MSELTASGLPKLVKKSVPALTRRLNAAPQRPARREKAEKPPPSSPESEKGVLGSMMIDPRNAIPEAYRCLPVNYFYNEIHRTIFDVMVSMWKENIAVDLITVTQTLGDRGLLQRVGGPGYVTELFTFVPSAVNISSYIATVREKFLLREIIATGTKMVRAAYGAEDLQVSSLIDDFSRTFEKMKNAVGGPNGSEKFEYSSLMAFDSTHDPNCLVGNRYLVRGGSSLWAGGSGYGKSALALQFAVHWACGKICFGGLRPVRPLKSLLIQAENDEGDMGEQLQGVIAGVSAAGEVDVEESRGLIERNVGIHRVVGKSGAAFLSLLELLIEIDHPDIVWIDPLFAFAGCDLMNAKETGRFVRDGLLSIAARKRVALNVIHHARKPSQESDSEVAEIDLQYFGFGTSDIQNAFRAVNILVPVGQSGVFKLVLSKRGERARAKDLDGHWTRSIFLKHSMEGICWLQCEEPDTNAGPGRPPKFVLKDVLDEMSVVHPIKTSALLKKLRDERNMSRATFFRLFDAGKNEGRIVQSEDGWIRQEVS